MDTQQLQETELANLIIDVLNLEDLSPTDISPEEPLFGGGLGLDSIDALELALALSEKYGVELRADDERNEEIFFSLRTLNNFVRQTPESSVTANEQ